MTRHLSLCLLLLTSIFAACADESASSEMTAEPDDSSTSEMIFCGSIERPLELDEVFTTFWNQSERHDFTFREAKAANDGTYDCEMEWLGGEGAPFEVAVSPDSGHTSAVLKIELDSPTGNVGTHLCENRQWMEAHESLSMESADGALRWAVERRESVLSYSVLVIVFPFDAVNRGTYHSTIVGHEAESDQELRLEGGGDGRLRGSLLAGLRLGLNPDDDDGWPTASITCQRR